MPDQYGKTELHWAAINGHRDVVELLVRRGASLDLHEARYNSTPAGCAREGSHIELAEFLQSS